MQPTLPIGFDSWAEVLTDWQVRRAYVAAKPPRCFSHQPALGLPFVLEISRIIRERQLRERPREAAFVRAAAEEPAYERIGGGEYLARRDAMEAAQESHFLRRGGATSARDMEMSQAGFYACRHRHRQAVEQMQSALVRDYWAQNPPRGLPDDFFAPNGLDSIPARMSRIDPAWWWRAFFHKLQSIFSDFHAADGCFLDELPALRTRAKKKKLVAEIEDWCRAHADRWGWDGPGHYRMLHDRAAAKAATQVAWANETAPGGLTSVATRESLHAQLTGHLTWLDPWARHHAAGQDRPSEHWRN